MALVVLNFAKMAGPTVFGELSSYLLIVTYSAFSVLGLNASFVKEFSLFDKQVDKHRLYNLTFFYTLLTGFLVALICLSIGGEGSNSLALICFFGLLRGLFQSALRARLAVLPLSFFNFVFSILYLIFYIVFVAYPGVYIVENFLLGWSLSLVVSCIFGLYLLRHSLLVKSSYFVLGIKDIALRMLLGSVFLFLISLGNMMLVSFDRVLLNLMGMPSKNIGLYQFADNVSSIFYLGSSALLYLLVPIYIKKLSSGDMSPQEFEAKFLKVAFIWLIPLVVFLGGAYMLLLFFFEVYLESYLSLFLLTVSKYITLLLFVPVTIFSALSNEKKLVNYYLISIIPMVALQWALLYFVPEYYWGLAVISSIFAFVIFCFSSQYRFNKFRV